MKTRYIYIYLFKEESCNKKEYQRKIRALKFIYYPLFCFIVLYFDISINPYYFQLSSEGSVKKKLILIIYVYIYA